MNSLHSEPPAALGALRPLPSHLCIPSPSHLSTSSQTLAMDISTMNPDGSLLILPRELYRFAVQRPDNRCPMRYLGCSYGYLIFSHREHCYLLDVYTGTKVKPRKLQYNGNPSIYYGLLVAPLSSPNSHLTLLSRTSIFQWQVGTDSWT
jgi:hypothetical protein